VGPSGLSHEEAAGVAPQPAARPVRIGAEVGCGDVQRAILEDPSGLFNSSLDGNTRRAIDIREGDKINEKALKVLIRAAIALNTS
jgi:hypothetical protein